MDLVIVGLLTLVMVPLALLASGVLRIVLAAAFLVFFPGYTLVAALFPRKDSLDPPERAAMSLILSVAGVSLMGLALNYTPWGITTHSVVGTISGQITLCAAAALCRRMRLPAEDRFEPKPRVRRPRIGQGTKLDKVLFGALLVVVLGAIGTLAYVIAFPKHVETFSEFYLLDPEGMMQSYPQEVIAGQSVEVTVAITNREDAYANYVVDITIDRELVSRTDTIRLANDRTWEGRLSFIPHQPGPDQRVDFVLYKNCSTEPYLTLHLVLDVTAG